MELNASRDQALSAREEMLGIKEEALSTREQALTQVRVWDSGCVCELNGELRVWPVLWNL